MAIRIVQLGSDRQKDEGIRIGTVRRPPRGVPKTEFASRNFYDVWLPNLSPSPEVMKLGLQAKTDKEWQTFKRKFIKEMSTPDSLHLLELLAALSHTTDFSVGCYCEDENHCHRSILRELLTKKGAVIK